MTLKMKSNDRQIELQYFFFEKKKKRLRRNNKVNYCWICSRKKKRIKKKKKDRQQRGFDPGPSASQAEALTTRLFQHDTIANSLKTALISYIHESVTTYE